MKKQFLFLCSSLLVLGTVGCDYARTSADAPTNPNEQVEVEEARQVEDTTEDAVSETRRDQLNSDIRAREQRNDALGDQQVRADGDLESEVRAKLEANIPRGKLTVEAEDGTVTVAGTVPSQDEYEKIDPLAREILGVNNVTVDVEVVPATQS